MKGTFIVLEGGEGAGKSSVARFLRANLSEKEFLITRAGGSPFGEKLRALFVSDAAAVAAPESRFFLALAAQSDHIQNAVVPALTEKQVISDRLDASIFAYQVYAEKETRLAELFWRSRDALLVGAVPDLYIFLDVRVEEGFSRLKRAGRSLDHFEKRPRDFHERVREGYLEFFTRVPHTLVDANRPLEEVQTEVQDIIKKHL